MPTVEGRASTTVGDASKVVGVGMQAVPVHKGPVGSYACIINYRLTIWNMDLRLLEPASHADL